MFGQVLLQGRFPGLLDLLGFIAMNLRSKHPARYTALNTADINARESRGWIWRNRVAGTSVQMLFVPVLSCDCLRSRRLLAFTLQPQVLAPRREPWRQGRLVVAPTSTGSRKIGQARSQLPKVLTMRQNGLN